MTSAVSWITYYHRHVQPTRLLDQKREEFMNNSEDILERRVNRRSFLRNGAIAAGTVTAGAALLSHGLAAFGQESNGGSSLTKGDIAILQFLAAAELIESDLWQQYAELGGIDNNPPIEVDPSN
jgi:hypothetical protein